MYIEGNILFLRNKKDIYCFFLDSKKLELIKDKGDFLLGGR
jgi:hypothetical protein